MDQFTFISLTKDYMEEVIRLEPQIYSHGWSRNLIAAEFDKVISRRYGILNSNGALVGYSFSYVVEDELHVLNLGIDPSYRNNGLGGKLLDYILDVSRTEGCHIGLLEVRRSNEKAKSLYVSRGFRVNGIRKNYYSDNGEDAFLMEASL